MTKISEHASVPVVGPSEREALAAALRRPDVVAAYLFGSQAAGTAGPLSDIDIAVLPSVDVADPGALRLEVGVELARLLGTDEVDVVMLDRAPPVLAYRVFRDGVRLVDNDPRARVRFETDALLRYLDTAPLRATLADGVRRRIAEGRFGRR